MAWTKAVIADISVWDGKIEQFVWLDARIDWQADWSDG